jgi:carbohydrate-selective porin OprB
LTLAFPNLGQEGNLGGIIVGMQPKLTATSQGLRAVGQFKDPDTSLHVEGFYRHQLTDNIAVTPGIIWLTAPNHNQNNDDTIVGTIRTTFTF